MAKNNRYSDAMADALRAIGKGGRVQSTQHAIDNRLFKVTTYGVITGWGHHKWTVQVRRDHRKTASAYHVDFWEPSTELPPAAAASDPHGADTGKPTTRVDPSSSSSS